ncbi:LysR family transcriptional regulator [Rhodopseudomonas palustris]|uniref:Transcriptional regulator, LysR family n=1 Tax=Rhodopseudomonas palustris (strain BisB18) TaxID=316056 RepID=Q212R5_RHOPB
MAITLKQIEALHWVVQLGTFDRAANRLHTSQSAVSKRIMELEAAVAVPIFDRSQRGARLTEQGEHLLALSQDMLNLQDRIMALKDAGTMPARRLRLGITELSALTWLPRLISVLRETFPTLDIEPDVDTSRDLYARLQEDELDLIVIPECFVDPEITSDRLAEVANVWFARPGLIKSRRALTLEELATYPVLIQGRRSGSGLFVNKWLKSQGVVFPRVLSSDNLTTVLALAVAGLGIGYLPRQCFRTMVAEGKLVAVPTKPALPLVPYSAMYRNDRPSMFIAKVVEIAKEVCDFSVQFQA